MSVPSLCQVVDLDAHPLHDDGYRAQCRATLDRDGALVLSGFLLPAAVRQLVAEAESLQHLAFHSEQTHTVYLETADQSYPQNDARSREVASTKGAVTADLVPDESALRTFYDDPVFRSMLCDVLGEDELFEYADPLSSINVNYFLAGQELGWHFDNSSFAVTLLVQAPGAGGTFEYIDAMRSAERGEHNEQGVAAVLDGRPDRPPVALDQRAGDLALFRGRDALHRVTPVVGDRTRILVVLAYNTEPGLSLSEHARMTFFGRLG
ncbi:MAG: 2OG-Fe(II) oxygenase [Actinobacteria bacterium]|nr:2OG-Fe(II) oxygenase [Actinomycetota bacterium]